MLKAHFLPNFDGMNWSKTKNYLKKLGVAGFLFFLIKGLIWLFVLLGGAKLLWGD